jgi:hypothetical protein
MSATSTRSLLRGSVIEPFQRRTATDYLIEGLTPTMVFFMVAAVLYFLLDVRYVYTEVHDSNIRFVAFFFVMGVVAANRLLAWEGTQEGILYFLVLAGVVALYTVATTGAYGVGSVARGFMNKPGFAIAFNLTVVFFIWWVTHRLTQECCVDENTTAGDIGILTGTLRRFQESLRRQPEEKKEEFYDPTAWKKPVRKAAPAPLSANQRLSKRHPGISIFYFSVPVMAIFALGLPVLRQGGPGMVLAGHFYVGVYTVAALSLLMLSSLGGLREYFRSRHIHIPAGLGPFWIGLGMLMIAVVLFGATALPMPQMPGYAAIDYHETDFWTRDSTFQLSVAAPAVKVIATSQFMERVGWVVRVALALFILYGILRAVGAFAVRIARQRHRYPAFVVRFFDWLDRVLQRLTNLPSLPTLRETPRISRKVALSAHYVNPMRDPSTAARLGPAGLVANAYEALCALAYDLGVPRREDQTPYEFIESFPKALDRLREEAVELTDLFVRASYSKDALDPRVEDRLRKFWITYERVRNRIVK